MDNHHRRGLVLDFRVDDEGMDLAIPLLYLHPLLMAVDFASFAFAQS